MFVKICGITHRSDAIAAAAAGADAIGLNFVPTSSRHVDVETARAIVAVVPDEVMSVGVFRDHPVAEVLEVCADLGLDAAQLHGAESPDDVARIGRSVPTVIKVFPVGSSFDGQMIDRYRADIVMLDAEAPGGGVPFDWALVGDTVARHRVLLAGGLGPDNVADAARAVRPWGVDVATGVETSPGQKDSDAMARFVGAARGALP